MIDHHRARILRMLAERPRRLRDFADGSEQLQVAARHIANWLDAMVDDGLVLHTKADEYRITEAGRAALKEQGSVAGKRQHHSNETYKGERWVIRPGAEDHKNHRSRGIDGGSCFSTAEES